MAVDVNARAFSLDSFTDAELNAAHIDSEPNVAVFVVHGMGQQTKFDTIEQVSRRLEEVLPVDTKTARNGRIGTERVSRMELGCGNRRVDVYEGYWAPITEGQIGIKEVIGFLTLAGRHGLGNTLKHFRRWVFSPQDYGREIWTAVLLLLTLAVLWALVVMNGFTVLLGGGVATKLGPEWMKSRQTINDVTAIAVMASSVLVAFALALGATMQMKSAGVRRERMPLVSLLTMGFLFLTLAATIAGAVVMTLTTHYHSHSTRATAWKKALASMFTTFAAALTAFAVVICGVALLTIAGTLAASVARRLLAAWRARKEEKSKADAGERVEGPHLALGPVIGRAAVITALGAVAAFLTGFLVAVGRWRGADPTSIFATFIHTPLANVNFVPASVAAYADHWTAVWAVLAAISFAIRQVLVQYVGDVAIYVQPHTLDRFDALRERIKDCIFKTADTIYRAKSEDGRFEYGNVVVIGHSLGSVAAYDALNRMLNCDEYVDQKLRVAQRTGRLITFGSPLDKTAFIFANHFARKTDERAALGATVQPLVADEDTRGGEHIADATERGIPWTNIWSRLDIISGDLDYYDYARETGGRNRVQNLIDHDAMVPLAAHTEYWDNPLLWRIARQAVDRVGKKEQMQVLVPPQPRVQGRLRIRREDAKGQTIFPLPPDATEVEIIWN